MNQRICLVLSAVLLISGGCCSAFAGFLPVPSEFSTLQAAVDASFDGDVVLVAPGVYKGDGNCNVEIGLYRDIVILSEAGAEETIIDCEGDGRGFLFSNCQSELIGFTVINGANNDFGGGILCDNAIPHIIDCVIKNNRASLGGGGIAGLEHSWPLLYSCVLDSNVVEDPVAGKGGGLFFEGDGNSSPSIQSCFIRGNTARMGGGLFLELFGPIKLISIINTAFFDNGAIQGGAAYIADSPPTFTNCTMVANRSREGGALFIGAEARPSFLNSIAWNNLEDGIPGQFAPGSASILVEYSDVEGGWQGEGNINVDPMFVDQDGANLHLSVDSPCINAGSNQWRRVINDIDLDVRPDPSSGIPDMGVDEYCFVKAARPKEDGMRRTLPPRKPHATGPRLLRPATDTPDTLLVPAEYSSIREAIEASVDGDLILVSPGTYYEHDLDFGGRRIEVRGDSGAASTVIDCQSAGRGFFFGNGESYDSRLTGFTIRSGYVLADGGAVACIGSSPTFEGNIFELNGAAAHNGGGMFCSGGSSPKLTGCEFRGNRSIYFGGGMHCRNESSPEISECLFIDNMSGYGREEGGGLYCTAGSSPIIKKCEFERNTGLYGGAICSKDHSSPVIEECLISENYAYKAGGGIAAMFNSYPEIRYCTIVNNIASRNATFGYDTGGGIFCAYYSSPDIVGNILLGNIAFNGGGIDCTAFSSPSIVNCIIAENIGDTDGGGLRVSGGCAPELIHSTLTGNIAYSDNFPNQGHGGGIRVNSSTLQIVNSIVWGNSARFAGNEIYVSSGEVTASYSDIGEGWPGLGNIDADPLFIDPEKQDFHIAEDSPCVDVALTIEDIICDVDRELRPDPLTGKSEIGADEVSQGSFCDDKY